MNEQIWETWVAETAQALPYPATPNVAGKVQARLAPRPVRPVYRLAMAGLVGLLLAGLMAVPAVRAGVLEFLNLGGITVFFDEPATPLPPSTLIALPNLPGETTLEMAQARLGIPIALPPSLGEPDYVFQYDGVGQAVTLVWAEERVVMQLLDSQIMGIKLQPSATIETEVGGYPALWITGEHSLTLYDAGFGTLMGMTRLIEGNVLIWQVDDVTYRLEVELDLAGAIALAETIE